MLWVDVKNGRQRQVELPKVTRFTSDGMLCDVFARPVLGRRGRRSFPGPVRLMTCAGGGAGRRRLSCPGYFRRLPRRTGPSRPRPSKGRPSTTRGRRCAFLGRASHDVSSRPRG